MSDGPSHGSGGRARTTEPRPLTRAGTSTLAGQMRYWVRTKPDATALVWQGVEPSAVRAHTWAELDDAVARAATMLAGNGVTEGDRVGVHVGNRPEVPILLIAAASLGAALVPTNNLLTAHELRGLLTHAQVRMVITEPGVRDVVDEALALGERPPVVELPAVPTDFAEHHPSVLDMDRDNLLDAAILYTSGSTAEPKGVRISSASLLNAGHMIAEGIGFQETDRNYAVLPFCHVNSLCYVLMTALTRGGSALICERFSASRYFDIAAEHHATVGWLAATPMRMILARAPGGLATASTLRNVVFGQNLEADQFAEWYRRFAVPLQQIYGMTETVTLPIMNREVGQSRVDAMGVPASGVEARVVDDDGSDVRGVGRPGMLLLDLAVGSQMMSGYLFDDDATKATFHDRWFVTGDVVTVDESGLLYFYDRAKDIIKVSGENVSAGEVERVVGAHPDVSECAVVGVADALRDQAVRAYVVVRTGVGEIGEDLQEWCAARLARFKVPREFVTVPELPRNLTGKVQKNRLHPPEGRR